MAIMTWEDRYNLDVSEMDDQHKQIIALMNGLHDANEAGDTHRVLGQLEALIEYTAQHFFEEENYMKSMGYPGLEVHRGTHRSLLKTLTEHAHDVKASGGRVRDQMFRFLRFWLASHICGIDMKYAKYSRGSRLAA